MKIKIHIDINTYEFVEMDIERETLDDLQKAVQEVHAKFNKLCRPEIDKGNEEASMERESKINF